MQWENCAARIRRKSSLTLEKYNTARGTLPKLHKAVRIHPCAASDADQIVTMRLQTHTKAVRSLFLHFSYGFSGGAF
jgi:hypothetical protein